MKLFRLGLLLGVATLYQCKSTDVASPNESRPQASASLSSDAPATPEQSASAALAQNAIPVEFCADDYNPSRCYFTELKGEEITESSRVYGWGLNPCSAHQALNAEIVAMNLNPSDFAKMICSPDVSQGVCTDVAKECVPATPDKKSVCKIASFDKKTFRNDEMIQTMDQARCDAKTLAKLELCKRNLYRKDAQFDLQCVQAPEQLQSCATSKIKTCPNTYSPKVCEAILPPDLSASTPLVSFARNECLAREMLERTLCFIATSMDFQQKIVCRSPD